MREEKPPARPTRDWRDETDYVDLERLDRRGFAWEYLRRNRGYRQRNQTNSSAVIEEVQGVAIIRGAIPPNLEQWGLRFRGIGGHRRPFGKDLLG